MKEKLLKIICFILCAALSFSLLCSCSRKEPNVGSSSDTAENRSEDPPASENAEAVESQAPEIIEPIENEEQEDKYADYYKFEVYNGENPIITNYRGLSGTTYHMFGFAKDDKSGRVYTDEMMDLELDRLKQSGMRYMRTRFDTKWAWDTAENGWNTDSQRMNYFYEYCRSLNEFEASVILQVGWNLDFPVKGGTTSITEAAYLGGFDNDLYGESSAYADCIAVKYKKTGDEQAKNANFRGQTETVTEYYERMGKAALRFGYLYAEVLKELKARGINNVEYLLYFTEPSSGYGLSDDMQMGQYANEYLYICQTIKNVLVKENVASSVKHIGPNQFVPHGNGLMRYVAEREPDLFDILSVHQYAQSSDITADVFYTMNSEYFSSYRNTLDELNLSGKKELWLDEYMALSQWFGQEENQSHWHGLQTVIGAITAQQYGIQNGLLWQMASQLWTDETFNSNEFTQGIHNVGILPSLFVTAVPNPSYYSVGLFTRYNGSQNGTVYRTNLGEHFYVYMGAVKLEDGSWTITVVNLDFFETPFIVSFDRAINQTLYRHVQGINEVNPTSAARLSTVDKVYKDVKKAFTDVVPAGSIAIYTGLKF